MPYSILYWCVSHIGRLRSVNQDNFVCDRRFMEISDANAGAFFSGIKHSSDHPLFGVFDGMGGEECGEVASYIAAKDAAELYINESPESELLDFCQKANGDICEFAENNGVFSMGTTAAMLAFTKKKITLCNIGDSKVFSIREGLLKQISVDHVANAVYGRKPPLSQNLGIPPTEMLIEPYVSRGWCVDGDIYLICSDGLTDMVSNTEIETVLSENGDISDAGKKLLDMALKNGGKDNVTFILCEIKKSKNRIIEYFKGKFGGKKR